ncbi:MAG: YfhO family protein [Acidobacteriota bacterium]
MSVTSWGRWDRARGRCGRAAVLLAGLVLTQVVLYGPSLCGRKLLLPLDCLARPGIYLPTDWPGAEFNEGDWLFNDAVLQVEPDRLYAVEEIRQGRLPLWNPYNYCGVPFLANNNSAVFSPFMLPSYIRPGPEVVAWTQLIRALLAGVGAYVFFRRAVGARFWPALIGAYCYPLVGYMVFWTWIHHSSVVAWLPWILLAVNSTVRRPRGWGGPALALVTCLTLLSGKLDTSGQVLLASGLYALWCVGDRHGWRGALSRRVIGSVTATMGGWLLGFALAAPVVFSTSEYLQTSARLDARRGGPAEFPGYGVESLPQLVLPYVYGAKLDTYVRGGNVIESAAAGYAGLLVALVLVPLAWSGRRRSLNLFWAAAGAFSLTPILHIPLMSSVYQLPPLSLFQNNRFAFFAAWCLLATGVNGLDLLEEKKAPWRPWFWPVALVPAGLGLWCAARAWQFPEWITEFTPASLQQWMQHMYFESSVVCGLAVGLWIALRWIGFRQVWVRPCVTVLVVGEMVYNAYGFIPQSDPALYYPKLPIFEALKSAPPGRICGYDGYLPANLNRIHRLSDVRGYDGADPKDIVRVLFAANPSRRRVISYAVTQGYTPDPSPILDMLNLRYVLLRGSPPANIAAWKAENDYWVVEHPLALPRPFVPRLVEAATDQRDASLWLHNPAFDPRELAFVESPAPLPRGNITGSAAIVAEVPGRLTIQYEMETPGVVVLGDQWFPGWHAAVDGQSAPVLRVNGVLQGVAVPAGKGTVELRYWPGSFAWGLYVLGLATAALLAWCFVAGTAQVGRNSIPS